MVFASGWIAATFAEYLRSIGTDITEPFGIARPPEMRRPRALSCNLSRRSRARIPLSAIDPLLPATGCQPAATPVLAAGGIADGRGLAATLMLGADGVLLGTRLFATAEALGSAAVKRRLIEASGDDTIRTRIFDLIRRIDWPNQYTGRAISTAFQPLGTAARPNSRRAWSTKLNATSPLATPAIWTPRYCSRARAWT